MKHKNIRKIILNETTNFCFNCNLRESCIEKACIIFRIEKIIENYFKLYNKRHNKIVQKYDKI